MGVEQEQPAGQTGQGGKQGSKRDPAVFSSKGTINTEQGSISIEEYNNENNIAL